MCLHERRNIGVDIILDTQAAIAGIELTKYHSRDRKTGNSSPFVIEFMKRLASKVQPPVPSLDTEPAIATHLAHFLAASKTTPATTPGCVAPPQCPTSLSTTSHSTPDPSMNPCAISGVNDPSSIALSQILRPSSALSAQSGGSTGVVMHCSACGMCVLAKASCSEGAASLKRWGMMGSKEKRPGAGCADHDVSILSCWKC